MALAFCLIFQKLGGAYEQEPGGEADEGPHFVTALMAHDYLRHPVPGNPLRFAEAYYVHYPKVSIGHWPPGFTSLQAVWMLVFGRSWNAVLGLVACITAAWIATLWMTLKRPFGGIIATAVSGGIAALPLVQSATQTIMADVLIAWLTLLASLAFGRFLTAPGPRPALMFSLFSSLAIASKSTGIALMFLPPWALAVSGRWRLWRNQWLWLSAGIVAVVCAPWYLLTWHMASNGLKPDGETFAEWIGKLGGLAGDVGETVTPVLGVLSLLGVWNLWRRRTTIDASALAVVMLGPAVLTLLILTPLTPEKRYLISALSAVAWLAASGISWIAEQLPAAWGALNRRQGLVAAASIALLAALTVRVPTKLCHGYLQLATLLQSRPEYANSLLMIASDPIGEGVTISAVAELSGSRPRTVVRSSKFLASSLWDNSGYQTLYSTPEEVEAALTRQPIGLVAIDRAMPEGHILPHHRMLEAALALHPDRWIRVAQLPVERADGKGMVEVFELTGHQQMAQHPLEIDMRHMLRRKLTSSPEPSL